MRVKKIILVANTDWYLYNFRLNLGKYLRQLGYEVVFVAPKGIYVDHITENGFRFIEWKVGRKSIKVFKEIISMLKLCKIYFNEKPELVHHFTIKPVIYGSLAIRFVKVIGVVNSITGLGYLFLSNDRNGNLLREFISPFYKIALNKKKTINIFENNYDREIFLGRKLVGVENSLVIGGVGVDEKNFVYSPEPKLDVPLVVLPARMLYDKGVKTLVDAAALLKRKTNVRIVLVGELDPGNPSFIDESTIRNWEKENGVEWWGFKNDMLEVYKNCNIVTLPSLGEGLPTVLIEAAACGRPIVTTDVAGCRDVVLDGVNGLLVPPNSPQALADAIYELVINPQLREKMGLEGRKIVLEKFTSKIINEKTVQIYNKLLI